MILKKAVDSIPQRIETALDTKEVPTKTECFNEPIKITKKSGISINYIVIKLKSSVSLILSILFYAAATLTH
ncbi:hypothetical protein Glove_551g21 [Diversispora epigaea]|uniref:Uncharacterized protein n=1 Tax=Diversispora epigaea TaxID=1348612 RepID=A0A397GE80_9GLOM|nr:hypothetical protein Glove_551g21 [Diversispora epigaea]